MSTRFYVRVYCFDSFYVVKMPMLGRNPKNMFGYLKILDVFTQSFPHHPNTRRFSIETLLLWNGNTSFYREGRSVLLVLPLESPETNYALLYTSVDELNDPPEDF